MHFDSLIFRRHPAFSVSSALELVEQAPALRAAIAAAENRFYLVRDRRVHFSDLLSLDLGVAQCLYSLAKPGPIAPDVIALLGADYFSTLVTLVCANVLQVYNPATRAFESGGGSFWVQAAFDGFAALDPPQGRTGLLSSHAIRYSWHFRSSPFDELAGKLYSYGAVPRRAATEAGFRDFATAIAAGAAADNGTDPAGLASRYALSRSADDGRYWLYWQHRQIDRRHDLRHKLYVSPLPEQTLEVFRIVADAANTLSVPAFKIASVASGLYRPDKIVLYFPEHTALLTAAAFLLRRLVRYPAQGVAFTTPISENGLLSRAVDPPGRQYESWRMYVAKMLAKFMKLGSFHTDRLDSALLLNQLRLMNIEPNDWNYSKSSFLWTTPTT